mgnify:CR=1 FL=1
MSSKKIILFIATLFFLSSAYLFFVDSRDSDPDFQKNWWVLYFASPKGDALDFVIENHSDKNNFHWEVFDEKNKINEGNVKIEKGATWASDVKVNISDKKITIIVSDGTEKKEIYKNFEN